MAEDGWADAPAAPAATPEDSEDSDKDQGLQPQDCDVPDAQGLLPLTNDTVTTDEEERLGRQRVLTRHFLEHPSEDVDSERDTESVDLSPRTRLQRRGPADTDHKDPEFFQYFTQLPRHGRRPSLGQLLRNFQPTDTKVNTYLRVSGGLLTLTRFTRSSSLFSRLGDT